MVELFEKDIREDGRRSSKGNQLKWCKDGVWYKADYTGYEGLAEYVVSHLLKLSSLSPAEYVLYDPVNIAYKKRVLHGASCPDLRTKDWQIITLERLFQIMRGESLNSMIYHISNHEDRLRMIVEETERITGLANFGVYMAKMLTVDSFFLNEDRHTHNIAIMMNGKGEYRLCPFFDQGAALLSDTSMDYTFDGDVIEMMGDVKSKTFCEDFTEQMDLAEKLYGEQMHFSFDRKEVDRVLGAVDPSMYDAKILDRVREILYQQMRKYGYLFA